jgi:hypothetical protein
MAHYQVRNDIRPNKVIIMKYKGLKVYHEIWSHAYVINRMSIIIIISSRNYGAQMNSREKPSTGEQLKV